MNNRFFDKEKKGFLSILSHELRNPLSAILSSVELLKMQEINPPGTALLLETIEKHIHDMIGVLNSLLSNSPIPSSVVVYPSSAHSKLPPVVRAIHHSQDFRTILIADDNGLAAEALGRLFELRGHTVSIAYNGKEAVQKAKAIRPQIVILDIGLPDMDGYEVISILQKEKDYAPTYIALTGYGQGEDKERARKAGFYKHCTKPVSLDEIEAAFLEVPTAA